METRRMSGNKNSGRKPKNYDREKLQELLIEAAPAALAYLEQVITAPAKGRQKVKPSGPRVEAAKFVLTMAVGKPPIQLIHTGDATKPIVITGFTIKESS